MNLRKRHTKVFFNAIRNYLPTLGSLIASGIVVNYYSKDLWGEFVEIFIILNLFNQLLFFGHREPSIRHVARDQSSLNDVFYKWLSTRALIYLVPLVYFLVIGSENLLLIVVIQFLFLINQSLQTVIIITQKFIQNVVIELISLIFYISSLFLFRSELSIKLIITCFSIHLAIKVIGNVLVLKREINRPKVRFDFRLFKEGLPFFLVLLGGFLSTRIDIFYIKENCSSELLGEYHIVTNFLLQGTALAGIVLIPISKHLYRLPYQSFKKLIFKMFQLGLVISTMACLLLPTILYYFYQIHVSNLIYLIIVMYISLPIMISPVVIYLFRVKKEFLVLTLNYSSALLHFLFLLFLYKGADLTSVLLIIGVTKVVVTGLYLFTFLSFKNRARIFKEVK